ncbi:MAG: hypothetical protein KIT09_15115 [Bryobacteraceae bacterium]|nr:hypothetical protein [Bryobacteraceae bacterium]
MRRILLGTCLCALAAAGQTDAERLREQVAAGVLPRKALEQAEQDRARARDESTLRETLYGTVAIEELTEEQTEEMVAAARRLAEHSRQQWRDAGRLIAEGVLARGAIAPYEEALRQREKTLELAEKRAALLRELAEIARAEETIEISPLTAGLMAERFDGDGTLRPSQFEQIRLAFEREFERPLPISARGDTALHRSLGFDHRGRVDVALHPDEKEGQWLLRLLEERRIPYFAFRTHAAGRSTGAHIHIGPQSEPFRRAD